MPMQTFRRRDFVSSAARTSAIFCTAVTIGFIWLEAASSSIRHHDSLLGLAASFAGAFLWVPIMASILTLSFLAHTILSRRCRVTASETGLTVAYPFDTRYFSFDDVIRIVNSEDDGKTRYICFSGGECWDRESLSEFVNIAELDRLLKEKVEIHSGETLVEAIQAQVNSKGWRFAARTDVTEPISSIGFLIAYPVIVGLAEVLPAGFIWACASVAAGIALQRLFFVCVKQVLRGTLYLDRNRIAVRRLFRSIELPYRDIVGVEYGNGVTFRGLDSSVHVPQ